MKYFIIS